MVDSDSTAKSVSLVPKDIRGNPISDEGQPAYLAGAFHEMLQWLDRSGSF